jgi:quinol monooxygenase YgiN
MPATQHFVVIAEFQLAPGALERFLPLAHDDARQSVATEEGCLAFDVLIPEEGDGVVFHEVYRDRAAFDRHQQTAHYARFKEGSAEFVGEGQMRVRFFGVALAD